MQITHKTNTAARALPAAEGDPVPVVSWFELTEELDCEGGEDCQAVLRADDQLGFALYVRGADRRCSLIVDEQGAPLRFRTIEQAMGVLQDTELPQEIVVDIQGWRPWIGPV